MHAYNRYRGSIWGGAEEKLLTTEHVKELKQQNNVKDADGKARRIPHHWLGSNSICIVFVTEEKKAGMHVFYLNHILMFVSL